MATKRVSRWKREMTDNERRMKSRALKPGDTVVFAAGVHRVNKTMGIVKGVRYVGAIEKRRSK